MYDLLNCFSCCTIREYLTTLSHASIFATHMSLMYRKHLVHTNLSLRVLVSYDNNVCPLLNMNTKTQLFTTFCRFMVFEGIVLLALLNFVLCCFVLLCFALFCLSLHCTASPCLIFVLLYFASLCFVSEIMYTCRRSQLQLESNILAGRVSFRLS